MERLISVKKGNPKLKTSGKASIYLAMAAMPFFIWVDHFMCTYNLNIAFVLFIVMCSVFRYMYLMCVYIYILYMVYLFCNCAHNWISLNFVVQLRSEFVLESYIYLHCLDFGSSCLKICVLMMKDAGQVLVYCKRNIAKANTSIL